MPTPEGLSTDEVARRAGVTVRQLRYWRTRGYVTPSIAPGTGRPGDYLRWSEEDVARARYLGSCSSLIQGGLAGLLVDARPDTPDVPSHRDHPPTSEGNSNGSQAARHRP